MIGCSSFYSYPNKLGYESGSRWISFGLLASWLMLPILSIRIGNQSQSYFFHKLGGRKIWDGRSNQKSREFIHPAAKWFSKSLREKWLKTAKSYPRPSRMLTWFLWIVEDKGGKKKKWPKKAFISHEYYEHAALLLFRFTVFFG